MTIPRLRILTYRCSTIYHLGFA